MNITIKNPDYSLWYDKNYQKLTGNGLWLNGNEVNTLSEEEYSRSQFRILITRLSTYFDSSESFSHKILYQIAKKTGFFPDLAFLPPVYDGPVFTQDNVPWLLGTKTKQGPKGFDLIAISNSIVQELVNVSVMLSKSGIPLLKSQRMADFEMPLIILGGSNALYTSLFFVNEPPVDAIFFGEDTECIAQIFSLCAKAKQKGIGKIETLLLLESVPGFIQPDMPKHTKRFIVPKLSINALLADAPISNIESNFGIGNLQISDGCPCFCSFCAESFNKKPYRENSAGDLVEDAKKIKAGQGVDKIDLFSFNFNMHSELYEIIKKQLSIVSSIGLKSQRFDMLAQDQAMLATCIAIGKSSITCGLEGISSRMRAYLHKSLSQKDLESSLRIILSAPIRELKVFLIATGLEEKEDFEDFEKTLLFIKQCNGSKPQSPRIIFSCTLLVRFPWTPLETHNAPDIETLKPIIAKIRNSIHKNNFEFRLSSDFNDYLLSQMLVRASKPEIYEALLAALVSTDFVFYRSIGNLFIAAFLKECEQKGFGLAELMSNSDTDANSAAATQEVDKGLSIVNFIMKPWLYFETGISRKFVLSQGDAAKSFIDNGFCLGSQTERGICKTCGACDIASRESITGLRKKITYSPQALKERIESVNAATVPVSFLVDCQANTHGLPKATIAIALASAIMKTTASLVPWYQGFKSSHWGPIVSPCFITGHDVITLLWQKPAAIELSSLFETQDMIRVVNEYFEKFATVIGIVQSAPNKCLLQVESPFTFSPNNYCKKYGLTFMLRKAGNSGDAYSLEFTKQALKKKMIRSLNYAANSGDTTNCLLQIDEKFLYEEFAKKAFILKNDYDWVRIKARAEMEF